MKIIFTSNHKILLYDSIMDIPAERDSMVNYFLLEDSGIGTDMHSFDALMSSIAVSIQNNKLDDAMQGIRNVMGNVRGQLQNYRPDFLAWACLIHSIDGKKLDDFNDKDVREIVKELSDDGLTIGQIQESLDEVKKKFPESWEFTSLHGQEAESETTY